MKDIQNLIQWVVMIHTAVVKCAELVISSYRRSFFERNSVGIASVRAGNVIGGGDWSTDRLIPDILKFENNEELIIRNLNQLDHGSML